MLEPRLRGTDQSSLEINLRKLASSIELKPDFLILGEFSPHSIGEKTQRILERSFPFWVERPYSKTFQEFRVRIYSQVPLILKKELLLDWAPPYIPKEKQQAYREVWKSPVSGGRRFDRSYFRFAFSMNGQEYHLLPLHLLCPWKKLKLDSANTSRAILGQSGQETMRNGFVDLLAKLSTAIEVERQDNPWFYQAKNFRIALESDDGIDLSKDKVILIGDMNIPNSLLTAIHPEMDWVENSNYKFLKGGFQDAFDETEPTYPSKTASGMVKGFPSLKIDHAFVNNFQVEAGEVLKWKGSDHYAIYLIGH